MIFYEVAAMSKDEYTSDDIHLAIKPEGTQSEEAIGSVQQEAISQNSHEVEFNPLQNSQEGEKNFAEVINGRTKTNYKSLMNSKPFLDNTSCESSESELPSASTSTSSSLENTRQQIASVETQCNFHESTPNDNSSDLFYAGVDAVVENGGVHESAALLEGKEVCKSSSKPYQCSFAGGCGRSFSTSAHLKYHTRTHTGEKPFICPYQGCNRQFTSSGHLKYHFSTHSGEKLFKCQHPECDREFAWPAHMKYHMKTHSGERPYKCSFEGCGKSFYVLQRLNVHKRVHTGERPFTCEVDTCMKSFTTAGNLKNHMRIHTGEKPYSCPFEGCQRTFTEHSSMRKHKLTHTGEKPYECEICGKLFSQSGSRNAHQKRHASGVSRTRTKDLCHLLVTKDENGKDMASDCSLSQIQTLETGENPDQVISQHEVALQPGVSQVTTADQLVLSQPVIGKEVSIETTPVLIQNSVEEVIGPNTAAAVMTLAETVMSQQALIQSMLNGATVISTGNQSNAADELSVVDHVLQNTEVEQIIQNVVGQQILNSHIHLPMADELGQTHGCPLTNPLTVDVNSFMHQQAQQLPNVNNDSEQVAHETPETGTSMTCDEVLDDQTDTQSSSSEEVRLDSDETETHAENEHT